ncbi:hypothetical protein [Rhodococcus sp. B10]|uniref:hypothetical protein n=1 Tax=Rhodococcus sp. B10 TaxID=2695876 RepID=UPI001431C240|nr:hypothetical protein [Rhodococcus sp. B10]NIL77659.1 hypothetical protein [Rhodococcus sp. B10]
MSQEPKGGIWLPDKSDWAAVFGTNSAEHAFLEVVTKAPTATLDQVAKLANAMGLVFKLKVEKKPPTSGTTS